MIIQSMTINKGTLLAELRKAGIKHTPENIIRIAKTPVGKIVFLETGDDRSGLTHILQDHRLEFAEQGILSEQIPDAIITAITQDTIIGYQGRNHPTPRAIYQYRFNGIIRTMAIQIASNGYIVSANPRSHLTLR